MTGHAALQAADLEVLRQCAAWRSEGHRVLLVTVVRTWGSSPRPPGAIMVMREDGRVAGSVSGGCIEDDLIAQVRAGGFERIAPGGWPRVVVYGVTAEEAHKVGLPCGGTLQLVLEPLHEHSGIPALLDALTARQLTRRTLSLASGRVTVQPAGRSMPMQLDEQEMTMVYGSSLRLLVIGGGELSRYLCQTALGLGFDITVCDPREEYAEDWGIPGIRLVRDMPDDAVLALQPDRLTAIVALTHDPKLDDLALLDALRTEAFYVGALGSRANHARRIQRLTTHFDLTAEEVSRLHGPAGLYIGSRTPPEIALSILAEIVAVKNGVAIPRELLAGPAKDIAQHHPAAPCAVALATVADTLTT